MALPKLDTPTYQLELPSNQQVVKYRPFLVKEQKILMMAQDADDKEDSYNMLSEIVDGCTFNNVDIKTMPIFDFEYLFSIVLQITLSISKQIIFYLISIINKI